MIRAFYLLPLLAFAVAACDPSAETVERADQTENRVAESVRNTMYPPTDPAERAGRAVDRATR